MDKKLVNLIFFLIVLDPIAQTHAMVDHDGISLVRKAVVRFDLALNTNVCREITQLFQHLQDSIQRYPVEFAECSVE